MAEKIAVKRYSEAFLAYAKDTCGQEKAIRDLHELKNKVIRKNPEFLDVLHNPGIAFHEKCEFIDRVLSDDFSPEIRHFLKLLLEKGRISQFLDIVEYIRASYSQAHVEDVVLKTTFPLSLELIRNIEHKLEAAFQRKFKFYIELDSSLLGGMQVIIGNKIIDGSVKRRLEDLREKLLAIKLN